MSENPKRNYEGMFLLESSSSDFQAASEPVQGILGRYQAEVLSLRAWDDRRLAYEIRGHKRGLYVLCYFKADPAVIKEIEHDCQLNEKLLRVLILSRLTLTEQEINAPTPVMNAAIRPPEARPGEASEAAPAPASAGEPKQAEAVQEANDAESDKPTA